MVSITRKRVLTLLGLAVLMAPISICLADDTRWKRPEMPGAGNQVVVNLLKVYPPYYGISLDAADIDPGIALLERSGIVRKIGETNTCGRVQLQLTLTERAQRLGESADWDRAFDSLRIPVGRFVYVQGSETMHTSGRRIFETFAVRFEGNANARFLLQLGPAAVWQLHSLPNEPLTLADVGKTVTISVPLVHSKQGWLPDPSWSNPPTYVCSYSRAKSGDLASLVEEINGAGFAHLADLRREETGDVAVSPFAIWYLDEFLSRSWQSESNDAVLALLRSVIKHAGMHATVWADPVGTSFSKVDAARVARWLCATTQWPPWDFHVDPDAPTIGPETHGLSLTVYMYLAFTPALGDRASLPSYGSNVMQAVRVDSPVDPLSVFLVWPSSSDEGTAWFRGVTYERWKAIATQFRDTTVPSTDILLEQSAYTEVPAAAISAFETDVEPGQFIDHALTANQDLTISRTVLHMTVDAAFHARSPKPIRVGPSTFEGHDYYFRPPVSRPSVSIIQLTPGVRPLMYVVEDRETGAILLLGVRE